MLSLEAEYVQLQAAGLVDKAAASSAIALERGEVFSVFEEVRIALYAAVAAITAGIGILVKENLSHIGPLTLITALPLAACACYGSAIRTQFAGRIRTLGGDYLLLLGALIISADLGYAESQFHWLNSQWSWYLLILAAVHAVTAYALNSRLVLSLSLTSLAAWFGIEGRLANFILSDNALRDSGLEALVCAGVILAWREVHRRLNAQESFIEVFEQFAVNLGFCGALILCFEPRTRLSGLVALAIIAAISIGKGMRFGQEIFVIYGIVYTTLGVCFLESTIASGLMLAILELATVILAVVLLWRIRHQLKAHAA
jgi:hypothetical protein